MFPSCLLNAMKLEDPLLYAIWLLPFDHQFSTAEFPDITETVSEAVTMTVSVTVSEFASVTVT